MSDKPYISHWRGPKAELNMVPFKDGQILFCADTGDLYIDVTIQSVPQRKLVKSTSSIMNFLGVVEDYDKLNEIIQSKKVTLNGQFLRADIVVGDYLRVQSNFTPFSTNSGYEPNNEILITVPNPKEVKSGDLLVVTKSEFDNSGKWLVELEIIAMGIATLNLAHIHKFTPSGKISVLEGFLNVEKEDPSPEYSVITVNEGEDLQKASFNTTYSPVTKDLKINFNQSNLKKIIIPARQNVSNVTIDDTKIVFTSRAQDTEREIQQG